MTIVTSRTKSVEDEQPQLMRIVKKWIGGSGVTRPLVNQWSRQKRTLSWINDLNSATPW